MRIPFPKTIPLSPLLVALAAVVLIQVAQGTDPAFAVLMLAAQVSAAVAFNQLGGLTHMAGAFCVFAVLPNVTVPELTHMVLGQPGDYNLQHPILTAGVCAVFFTCMMIAALVVSFVRHPVALSDRVVFSIVELRIVSILSCALAVLISIEELTQTGPVQEGTLLSALHHFVPLLFAVSVMLATYVRLNATGGRSALNWFVVSTLVFSIIPGLLSASKEGMLTPLLCWIVVVASSGHRFTLLGTLGLVTVLFIAWIFVYPFSQNARTVVRESESLSDKMDLIVQFIRDPSLFPDSISTFSESDEYGVASSKVNIIKRYSLLQSNDMLIDADLRSGYTSIDRYTPILFAVVPHALWPDRPDPIFSNELGHKAGFVISDADITTGISIGSPSMFYDVGGWAALVVYSLICFALFFFAVVRLVGTSERSIWGLVPVGTEALIAGAASPSSMFMLLVYFVGMFLVLIGVLKTVSYISEALISKPVST